MFASGRKFTVFSGYLTFVRGRLTNKMPVIHKQDCKHGPTNTFVLTSPIGELELQCCPKGVHSLSLSSVDCDKNFNPDTRKAVDIVSQLYQDNGYTYKPAVMCKTWLQAYFEDVSKVRELSLPPICYLSVEEGTQASFTEKVWHSLAYKVPLGETVSYGKLACLSGSTARASRAVGQAMRTNHAMIIIPCHRVILSSGQLGNYSGGTKNTVKEWLLRHEGVF